MDATPDHAHERPDIHNPEIDSDLAERQLCGMTHLSSGNVCMLPERHVGGCHFVKPVGGQ